MTTLAAPWTSRWEWTDRPGLETLVVSRQGDEIVAGSDLLVVLDGMPTRIDYRLVYDLGWQFLHGHVGSRAGSATQELETIRGESGDWRVNGEPRPDLAECSDVDFMATPFTNTPPLWRFELAVGEARAFEVAWVRLPDLEVKPVRQEYRRLDAAGAGRYLYRNLESGFEGELTVDEHRLVIDYGPWRRLRGQ